jgi:prolyl-tRNA synthetase
LLDKAKALRTANFHTVDSYEEMKNVLQGDKGGFVLAHWDGKRETAEKIKEELKATIRCIPRDMPEEEGKCILTGAPSKRRVIFAKAY